jgi:hypothetical protein
LRFRARFRSFSIQSNRTAKRLLTAASRITFRTAAFFIVLAAGFAAAYAAALTAAHLLFVAWLIAFRAAAESFRLALTGFAGAVDSVSESPLIRAHLAF